MKNADKITAVNHRITARGYITTGAEMGQEATAVRRPEFLQFELSNKTPLSAEGKLRRKILRHLRANGYIIKDGILIPPKLIDKDAIRQVYVRYRFKMLKDKRRWIEQVEPNLLSKFADGAEVVPERLDPVLVPVETEFQRKLFTYASLLWSVPPSPGYGRRMRYLVIDRFNGKLIGILGLCDPVLGLRARDEWIGWTKSERLERLWHVMNAQVLGAVPPYSYLLGGKLVAMLAMSNEVRQDFERRYAGKPSVLSGKVRLPYLVMLMATSALGRSSMLNRLKFGERLLWQPIGWTQGKGHFLFMDGLFDDMLNYLRMINDPIAYEYKFGNGPNWRIRVIKRCLHKLGFNAESLLCHGIRRQVFCAELSPDARPFLRGELSEPRFYNLPIADLVDYFKERWLLSRAQRDDRFRMFKKESIILSQLLRGG